MKTHKRLDSGMSKFWTGVSGIFVFCVLLLAASMAVIEQSAK